MGVAVAGVMLASGGRNLSPNFPRVDVEIVDGSVWFRSPSFKSEASLPLSIATKSTWFDWTFGGDPPETTNALVFRVALRRPVVGGSVERVEGVLLMWPIALAALVSGATLVVMGRRVARRARLGYCPACNYNLSGIAVGAACPECGTRARSASKGDAG